MINIFPDVAVYIARQVFHEDRLVVHQEYDTVPTEIPKIGIVSGPLDYVLHAPQERGICVNSIHGGITDMRQKP